MRSGRSREKQLASDQRAGWSARTSIRERHRAAARAQWRPLALLAAGLLVVVAVASFFATGPVQQGALLGGGTVLTCCMLVAFVVLTSGTAPLIMGEWAEQWTAQELRPLSKHGWKLVNHFGLGRGDHDHVVVGPGGVVLVETKWGGTPWDVDAKQVTFGRALEQTARNAKQLALWHEVARHGRPRVEAVLVVWGPAARQLRDLPPRRHESGVVVMCGDQLEDWMLRRGRGRLSADQVGDIWAAVDRQTVRRDQHERLLRPMPRSLGALVVSVLTVLGLVLGCFLLSGRLLQLTGSLLGFCAFGAAWLAGAEVTARRSRFRWEARTYQMGLVGLYLLTGVAIARAYLER